MLEHWEKLGDEANKFKEQLEALLEMVPQSAKFYAATNNINKHWKRVQHAFSEMDPFITPVKSVEVNNALLAHPALAQTWELWKEYLVEQHGIHLRSRAEVMGLKRLSEISGGDAAKAARYLEFAMSRTDKNFYAVNDTELPASKTTDAATSGKTVVKLPVQYLQQATPESVPATTFEPVAALANSFSIKAEVEKFKKGRKAAGSGSRK